MKQIIRIVLVGIIFLLLAGCSGFYHSIPKDTVMVKKLKAKQEFNVKSDTVLSEETIKTLSLNAIGKYYDHHLSMDNVKIELMNIEYNQLKTLLSSAIKDLNLEQEIVDSYILQLNKATSGLYFVNITNLFNEYDMYTITINPLNGEILRAGKKKIYNKLKIIDSERMTEDELKQSAKQFIEKKEMITIPIDSSRIEVRNLDEMFSELYYASEDRQVFWQMTINHFTQEVLDFSKDIMAAFEIAAANDEYKDR